jgi:hypothetical protein
LTPELLREVFEIQVLVDAHPVTGAPRITPVHFHAPVETINNRAPETGKTV